MSVNITYFTHSTTWDNLNGIASGWNDVELSDLGVRQAHNLRDLTQALQVDMVICSDLRRAVETAEIAWKSRAEIRKDSRLRECNYGDFNGGSKAEVDAVMRQSIYEPVKNGECYKLVETRMASLLSDLAHEFDNQHIALIGHQAPQLALDVLLKNQTWPEAITNDWRKRGAWQPGWSYKT